MNKKKFQKKNLINFYSSNFFNLKKKKNLTNSPEIMLTKINKLQIIIFLMTLTFITFHLLFFFWFDQSH